MLTRCCAKKGQLTISVSKYFHGSSLNKDEPPQKQLSSCEEIPPDWWIRVRWLVNCLVRSARTATDMSQDVCHRQRRSLNEFQSGRAKKTRAEHARIKSSGAGAALREAPNSRAPPRPIAPPRRAPNAQLNHAIKTFTTMRYITSHLARTHSCLVRVLFIWHRLVETLRRPFTSSMSSCSVAQHC